MAVKMVKTTTRDFAIFKKECRRWIEYFGLIDWRVVIVHEELDEKEDAWGRCIGSREGKIATIILNKDGGPAEDKHIKLTAFHEVVELLLMEMHSMILDRSIDRFDVDRVVHTVVRTLENCIFFKRK